MVEEASVCTIGFCGCTLQGQALGDRRQYIRQRIAPHVVNIGRNDNSLSIQFSEHVGREDLEKLVEMERQCCGFLSFQLIFDGTPELTIAGEREHLDVLDMWVVALAARETS